MKNVVSPMTFDDGGAATLKHRMTGLFAAVARPSLNGRYVIWETFSIDPSLSQEWRTTTGAIRVSRTSMTVLNDEFNLPTWMRVGEFACYP